MKYKVYAKFGGGGGGGANEVHYGKCGSGEWQFLTSISAEDS